MSTGWKIVIAILIVLFVIWLVQFLAIASIVKSSMAGSNGHKMNKAIYILIGAAIGFVACYLLAKAHVNSMLPTGPTPTQPS